MPGGVPGLPRYQDRGRPFSAFVYTIASHKVADAHRAAVRDPTPIEAVPERADGTPDPADQAVTSDLHRRLTELLCELPPRQREIIVLRVAVGLSAEQVGGALGMSAAAVRMAQSRAMARLRALAPGVLSGVAA